MSDTGSTDDQRAAEQSPAASTYNYLWWGFTDWCRLRRRDRTLPISPETVVEYLRFRQRVGVRPSTLKVACAAIAWKHTRLEFPNPCESDLVKEVLADAERLAPPSTARSLPLDLECYRAIRRTALLPRLSRSGRIEPDQRALDRGRKDLAMIGLMRDGMLRVREASGLRWSSIRRLDNGTGRLRLGDGEDATFRTLSADTMQLLDTIRIDVPDDEPVLGLRPNQITLRIGAAAEHAGLGPGYSGESPRLGMLKDLEELGVLLIADQLEHGERDAGQLQDTFGPGQSV